MYSLSIDKKIGESKRNIMVNILMVIFMVLEIEFRLMVLTIINSFLVKIIHKLVRMIKKRFGDDSIVIGIVIGVILSGLIFLVILFLTCVITYLTIPDIETTYLRSIGDSLFKIIVFIAYFLTMCYAFKISKENDKTRKGLYIVYFYSYCIFLLIEFGKEPLEMFIKLENNNIYIAFQYFGIGINSIKEAMISGVIYDSIKQIK